MRRWKICVAKDSSVPMLGLHGLHIAFHGLPGIEMAALFDQHEDNAVKTARLIGAPRHYADYLAMLDQERPDIVVLCSRHPSDHLPQIQAAAERGVHVFCEKPMTASLMAADRIVDLSETHKIKICMAHPARYAPAFRTMKAMIAAGAIGAPLTAYGKGKCDHRGGGEDLIVLGTHILDLQTFMFGAPTAVWADIAVNGRPAIKTDQTPTVEPVGPTLGDDIYAVFRFDNGVRGIFETRQGLYDYGNGVNNMGLCVSGNKGTFAMLFDDRGKYGERSLRISRRASQPDGMDVFEDVPVHDDRVIPGAAPLDYAVCGQPDICGARFMLEGYRFAAWDLMQAIQEDRLPVSNQYTARVVQEMIQGIYAAHLSGGLVVLPPADRRHPLA